MITPLQTFIAIHNLAYGVKEDDILKVYEEFRQKHQDHPHPECKYFHELIDYLEAQTQMSRDQWSAYRLIWSNPEAGNHLEKINAFGQTIKSLEILHERARNTFIDFQAALLAKELKERFPEKHPQVNRIIHEFRSVRDSEKFYKILNARTLIGSPEWKKDKSSQEIFIVLAHILHSWNSSKKHESNPDSTPTSLDMNT